MAEFFFEYIRIWKFKMANKICKAGNWKEFNSSLLLITSMATKQLSFMLLKIVSFCFIIICSFGWETLYIYESDSWFAAFFFKYFAIQTYVYIYRKRYIHMLMGQVYIVCVRSWCSIWVKRSDRFRLWQQHTLCICIVTSFTHFQLWLRTLEQKLSAYNYHHRRLS